MQASLHDNFFQHIYYPNQVLDELEQRLINLGVSLNMLQSFDGYIYMYQHTKVWGFPFITIVSLKVIPPIVLFQPRS